MKPQHSLTIPWKSIAVAIALALVLGVASVQAAPPANQITVHAQDLTSGVITAAFGTAASMAQATTALAATAATTATVSTKPAAGASSIVIPAQDLTSGVIKVSSANSPVDGWIVVYKDPSNFTSNQVVGYAPVHQGANSDVKVTIDTAKAGDLPTLWAVLQADNGIPGVFEWGLRGRP